MAVIVFEYSPVIADANFRGQTEYVAHCTAKLFTGVTKDKLVRSDGGITIVDSEREQITFFLNCANKKTAMPISTSDSACDIPSKRSLVISSRYLLTAVPMEDTDLSEWSMTTLAEGLKSFGDQFSEDRSLETQFNEGAPEFISTCSKWFAKQQSL